MPLCGDRSRAFACYRPRKRPEIDFILLPVCMLHWLLVFASHWHCMSASLLLMYICTSVVCILMHMPAFVY